MLICTAPVPQPFRAWWVYPIPAPACRKCMRGLGSLPRGHWALGIGHWALRIACLDTTGEAWCNACSKPIARGRKRVLCMSHWCTPKRTLSLALTVTPAPVPSLSLSPGPDPEPDSRPPALTLNLTLTLASYHRECFKCATCNKPLYVGFTIGEDGGTYCRQCQR